MIPTPNSPWQSFNMFFADRRVALVRSVVLVCVSALYLLGSALIWPYLFQVAAAMQDVAGLMARSLVRLLLWSVALVLVAVGLYTCLSRAYRYLVSAVLGYSFGVLVFLFGMIIVKVDIIAVPLHSVIGSIIGFIVRVLLSSMMAVVPALLVSGIAHGIRAVILYRSVSS